MESRRKLRQRIGSRVARRFGTKNPGPPSHKRARTKLAEIVEEERIEEQKEAAA